MGSVCLLPGRRRIQAWVTHNQEGGTQVAGSHILPFCKMLEILVHCTRAARLLSWWPGLPDHSLHQSYLKPFTPRTGQKQEGYERRIAIAQGLEGLSSTRDHLSRQACQDQVASGLEPSLTLCTNQPEGTLTFQRVSPGRTAGQHSSTACTHPSTLQLSAWCS